MVAGGEQNNNNITTLATTCISKKCILLQVEKWQQPLMTHEQRSLSVTSRGQVKDGPKPTHEDFPITQVRGALKSLHQTIHNDVYDQ